MYKVTVKNNAFHKFAFLLLVQSATWIGISQLNAEEKVAGGLPVYVGSKEINFEIEQRRLGQSLSSKNIPLYYWREPKWFNFGDYISLKLVERIVNRPVQVYVKNQKSRKLLAIGSILYFAAQGDVVWGSGINGKRFSKKDYSFTELDVRSVRGPCTREFLMEVLGVPAPEVYGDPALLFPYLFPEFKRKAKPSYDYVVIPHYLETHMFPPGLCKNVVYPTESWDYVVRRILDSKFVIASSLHGIIIAEAFGIPARMLRVTEKEPLFKYIDYYRGTNRPHFQYARSIEEALKMGGEKPFTCDLKKLYESFPFDLWPGAAPRKIEFTE